MLKIVKPDRTIDKILGVVFGKVNMGADKKLFEYVELDENFRKLAMMGIGTETKKRCKSWINNGLLLT